ncbi:MAG: winged helix-turn-helix transcriptional regulator, partial [Anaerolineales bacterium]|nr:winged helix-turn-helix transcriptional regulator [Anaerolineales bacterium]
MGRRKKYPDDERLRTLLATVHAHPWARIRHLAAYCRDSLHGLSDIALPLAARANALECASLAGPAHREQRFALTPDGAALIGVPYDRARLQDAFLRANNLDAARHLLGEWAPRLVWAVSPFTVPAGEVRPIRTERRAPASTQAPREPGPGPYRSLRLDALACVAVDGRNYAHLAIQFDAGGLDLDWFYQQYRSVHAWGWRPQFRDYPRGLWFPTFVVVAANHTRLRALQEAWTDAAEIANRGEPARNARFITLGALAQSIDRRDWRCTPRHAYGDGPVTVPWVYTVGHPAAHQPPAHNGWPWCGAASDATAAPVPVRRSRGSTLSGFTPPTKKRDKRAALLARQYHLSWRGRVLLDHIGQYPLITASELAIVVGRTPKAVYGAIHDLEAIGLITHPAANEPGYVLTDHGLALLAAQVGLRPTEFARQRHWPTHKAGHAIMYSVQGLLACRAHSRLVLDFLV